MSSKGFSLVELAVAVAIIALLLAGALPAADTLRAGAAMSKMLDALLEMAVETAPKSP